MTFKKYTVTYYYTASSAEQSNFICNTLLLLFCFIPIFSEQMSLIQYKNMQFRSYLLVETYFMHLRKASRRAKTVSRPYRL